MFRLKLAQLFLIFYFLFISSPIVAQHVLPTGIENLENYRKFVQGQKILSHKAIQLPQSPYTLLYVSVERQVDKDNWSNSPADGIIATIFVYNNNSKVIDKNMTDLLNKLLGGDKYYQPNFCGGLGSFENWEIQHNKVVLSQVYAPASEIIDCVTYIFFDGKNIMTSKNPVVSNEGMAGMAAKERNAKNTQALTLLQQKKIKEAIVIWKELYDYIKTGPYATEGKIDEFMNNLGFAYWKNKQYKEAEPVLLECYTRFPQREVLLINLGDLYRDMKNTKQATFYYQKIQTSKLSKQQKEYATKELKKLKAKKK